MGFVSADAPESAPAADTMPPEQAAEFVVLGESAGEEPAAPGSSPGEPGAPAAAAVDWSMAAAGIVGAFAVYADNWSLTAEEQSKLASHLAPTLAAFFPNAAVDARWQAAGGLAMVLGTIAMSRRDASGRFMPLRKQAARAAAAAPANVGGLVLKPSGEA